MTKKQIEKNIHAIMDAMFITPEGAAQAMNMKPSTFYKKRINTKTTVAYVFTKQNLDDLLTFIEKRSKKITEKYRVES